MRKIVLSILLLTSIAAPALAQDRREYRDDRREERQDYRDDRREFREDRRDARRDAREDFRDDRREYRQQERFGRYRGGAFYYPAGYAYRYYGPGVRVPRAYFTERYYIGRPDFYRLPAAWRGTRWIRVGGDALLIRRYDGVVVRSVRGLFY